MSLTILRADALKPLPDGFELRVSLPWIRALPLRSLRDVSVRLDGTAVDELQGPEAGDRWWPAQDRVVLRGRTPIAAGAHEVEIDFGLVIPYLQIAPDGPLQLPFHEQRTLHAHAHASGGAGGSAARSSVSDDIA